MAMRSVYGKELLLNGVINYSNAKHISKEYLARYYSKSGRTPDIKYIIIVLIVLAHRKSIVNETELAVKIDAAMSAVPDNFSTHLSVYTEAIPVEGRDYTKGIVTKYSSSDKDTKIIEKLVSDGLFLDALTSLSNFYFSNNFTGTKLEIKSYKPVSAFYTVKASTPTVYTVLNIVTIPDEAIPLDASGTAIEQQNYNPLDFVLNSSSSEVSPSSEAQSLGVLCGPIFLDTEVPAVNIMKSALYLFEFDDLNEINQIMSVAIVNLIKQQEPKPVKEKETVPVKIKPVEGQFVGQTDPTEGTNEVHMLQTRPVRRQGQGQKNPYFTQQIQGYNPNILGPSYGQNYQYNRPQYRGKRNQRDNRAYYYYNRNVARPWEGNILDISRTRF